MKMKQLTSTVFILLLVNMLAITFNLLPNSVAEDFPHFEVLDEIGTHFELPRFNISITTDTSVHMLLRACSSEMISYFIENASDAMSTQLTLGYLKPFTTYYLYEDSYVNENVISTDDCGTYTYVQDLSKLHFVFIQPRPGTVTISESTTLHSDIYGSVAIIANNIVLDLNGYDIVGTGGWLDWIGIDVTWQHNVTIKNGGIRNHLCGIYLGDCYDIVIRNNTMSSNPWCDISMSTVAYSLFTENDFNDELECGWGSSRNTIYHNNFFGGCWNYYAGPNSWDDGYPSGGNYWSDYTGVDLYNGPDQNIVGSDGIGDSPYEMDFDDIDYYPLMNPWTPTEAVVKISGIDEPVTIVSNTAIGPVTANKNNLKFTSSELTGSSGYINFILPMSIVTSDIKVSIDRKEPASPFPIINANGTHYFIYFEFTLSTHIVTIQFAPSITAITDIDPNTLNLKSNGNWITGYIELAEEYDVNDIDVSAVMLNGTVPAELNLLEVGDHDGDGVFDLMVKFNRTEVSQYICEVQKIEHGIVTLTIKGELYDGATFEGSDMIRVRMPGDADCDGKVEIKDASLVARSFGAPSCDSYCDLNEDGRNDVKDLAIVCRNFGKKYQ